MYAEMVHKICSIHLDLFTINPQFSSYLHILSFLELIDI